ncbi:MAG: MoaD/ThiS family protein [Acidimicrobiales bacterium]
MPVEIRLPTVLRSHAAGQSKVTGEGATVRELFADLIGRYPGLASQILTDDGSLHRFVNIYRNDDDIRFLGALDATVGETDVITILPAVAGGARFPSDR